HSPRWLLRDSRFLVARRPPSPPLLPYTTLFRSAEAARLAVAATRTDGVRMGGTFTHLYASEEEDEGPTREQLARFDELVAAIREDRKSTRLNSSHVKISYAVFCLKKKKRNETKR